MRPLRALPTSLLRMMVTARRQLRCVAALAAIALGSTLGGCATPLPGAIPAPDSATPTTTPIDPSPAATDAASPLPTTLSEEMDPDDTADVSVVIITLDVVSGAVEASGMVPELVEDDGECTLTIYRGDDLRTVSGRAVAGKESTYCELLTYTVSSLGPGDWQATLAYRSASHYGVSAADTVSIP